MADNNKWGILMDEKINLLTQTEKDILK